MTQSTDSNAQLDKLFSSDLAWIYTDGGASCLGQKTGAYAANILFPPTEEFPAGEHQIVVGACNQTKKNRMELGAFNARAAYSLNTTMRTMEALPQKWLVHHRNHPTRTYLSWDRDFYQWILTETATQMVAEHVRVMELKLKKP